MEDITDIDYNHAKKMWKEFKIKNLVQYHNFYVQIYLKNFEINVLKYMNLSLLIFYHHLD